MGFYYPSPEKRIGYIETIKIQEGWRANDLDRGFFCSVSHEGICVEAFGMSPRSALRYARRAWRKEKIAEVQKKEGYPRVIKCEDKFPYIIKHEFHDDYRKSLDQEEADYHGEETEEG